MDPVVHFEMPYDDANRLTDFYKKAFGWTAQITGPEMGNYIVVHTTETDEKNMVKKPRTINGGFFKRSKENQVPGVVIAVSDIKASIKKVEESGGKVIGASKGMEPDMIPGIGLYISIEDTEGNKVALLQPMGM